ncbi:hypothetical protein FNH05_13345 [Amycolatopsis rhizosphaerae]|uniref:Arc family DNA-binding protein n=1 Tax=Amycolatopsis rhizosphaerae TaxID=2053003 RepID=A0A558CTS7_9PSEU|nr:hypothetical protein [Amycolatopsis rhizosphaerae]TVT52160.1 hypothetical protein FNH05_13345 [Amycolatopsis rhizosphaerae]
MDLSKYVDGLGRDFASLAEGGGNEARELLERIAGSLESSIRLTLLDALSAATDEITRELAPGSVELRLRGREPNFVVTPPPAEAPHPVAAEPGAEPVDTTPVTEEAATARINFRLPEQLKAAIEEAAGREGRSVNAWLVRVASAALHQRDQKPPSPPSGKVGPKRYQGWAR